MMGEFKDMIREDIKEIFLDLEMFGEEHVVADKKMIIILDDGEKLRRNEQYQDDKAIYSKRLFFYAASDDLGGVPELGRVIDVDGRDYTVLQADEEDGICSIMAEEYRE